MYVFHTLNICLALFYHVLLYRVLVDLRYTLLLYLLLQDTKKEHFVTVLKTQLETREN
jgi:hypothetical protein